MSAPEQVTEEHRALAANAIGFKTVADANYWGNCSDMQKIDKIAKLIADREAKAVALAMNASGVAEILTERRCAEARAERAEAEVERLAKIIGINKTDTDHIITSQRENLVALRAELAKERARLDWVLEFADITLLANSSVPLDTKDAIDAAMEEDGK